MRALRYGTDNELAKEDIGIGIAVTIVRHAYSER
jgi:hypothetical protein